MQQFYATETYFSNYWSITRLKDYPFHKRTTTVEFIHCSLEPLQFSSSENCPATISCFCTFFLIFSCRYLLFRYLFCFSSKNKKSPKNSVWFIISFAIYTIIISFCLTELFKKDYCLAYSAFEEVLGYYWVKSVIHFKPSEVGPMGAYSRPMYPLYSSLNHFLQLILINHNFGP